MEMVKRNQTFSCEAKSGSGCPLLQPKIHTGGLMEGHTCGAESDRPGVRFNSLQSGSLLGQAAEVECVYLEQNRTHHSLLQLDKP